MTSFWWGRGVPWGARLRARSINPRMEGLQPWPNRWGPYFVQCSRLREAHRAHPRSQTGQRTSSQGACFEGSEFSKVVASMLFHFFGTLMRDFELQHSGHPRFSASPAAAVVQQMATTTGYDARRAVGRGPVPWGVADGFFASATILLEFIDASKGALSRSNPRPRLTRCLCSPLAHAARALRAAAECADAAGTVCGNARMFCGAGAVATAVAANRSLYPLDKVTPPRVHLPFLDAF